MDSFDYDNVKVRLLLISKEGPLVSHVDQDHLIAPTEDLSNRSWIMQVLTFIFKVIPFHYRYIKSYRPDVIMTCTEWMNDYGLMICRPSSRNATWVTRSGQNTLANARAKSRLITPFLNFLASAAHNGSDGVIVPCEGLRKQFITRFSVNPDRIVSVYNPLNIETIQKKAQEQVSLPSGNFILAIGRLERQKRFDLLIEAFSKSSLPSSGYDLVILGTGGEEKNLRELIRKMPNGEYIHLQGFVDNPYAYLARAKAFVLASDWEGFAHVVAEALACNVPVIASDCDFGPNEILENGRYGTLFPPGDEQKLTEQLNEIPHYKRDGIDKNILRFETKKIAGEYVAAFAHLSKKRSENENRKLET